MQIDYKIDSAIRWKVLTDQIDKFSRDEKHELILAALHYRSGSDSCNSVYMGGMATASLCRAIGKKYGDDTPWMTALWRCTEHQIDAGIQVCMHTIEYMWENPRTNCPVCGQIVKADE